MSESVNVRRAETATLQRPAMGTASRPAAVTGRRPRRARGFDRPRFLTVFTALVFVYLFR
jgi:hypothetical protein